MNTPSYLRLFVRSRLNKAAIVLLATVVAALAQSPYTSFDDLSDPHPGWTLSVPAGCTATVTPRYGSGSVSVGNCLYLRDNSSTNAPYLRQIWNAELPAGRATFWVKIPDNSRGYLSMDLGDAAGQALAGVRFQTNGTVGYYGANASGAGQVIATPMTYQNNRWYCVRLDWYGNRTFTAYLDGVPFAKEASFAPLNGSANPRRITFKMGTSAMLNQEGYLDDIEVVEADSLLTDTFSGFPAAPWVADPSGTGAQVLRVDGGVAKSAPSSVRLSTTSSSAYARFYNSTVPAPAPTSAGGRAVFSVYMANNLAPLTVLLRNSGTTLSEIKFDTNQSIIFRGRNEAGGSPAWYSNGMNWTTGTWHHVVVDWNYTPHTRINVKVDGNYLVKGYRLVTAGQVNRLIFSLAAASSGTATAYVDDVYVRGKEFVETDDFGVRKLYASLSPGVSREWYSKWHTGSKRLIGGQQRDPQDPDFLVTGNVTSVCVTGTTTSTTPGLQGPGTIRLVGSSPRIHPIDRNCNEYLSNPQANGILLWRNVEQTAYFYIEGQNQGGDDKGVGSEARLGDFGGDWGSNPAPLSWNKNTGYSYNTAIRYKAGRTIVQKEVLNHTMYTSANPNSYPWTGGVSDNTFELPTRQWFGNKFVVRNFANNTCVHLESWIDPDGDNQWVKALDFNDTGAWSAYVNTNGEQPAYIPFRSPTGIITQGTPDVRWRADYANPVLLRDSSVREIAPLDEESGSSQMLQGVVSRKVHGTTTFDLLLESSPAALNIEPRSGRETGRHQLVFHFDQPVSSGGISVLSGVGTVESLNFVGQQIILNLTNVANGQSLVLSLENIAGFKGTYSGTLNFTPHFGDVNRDGVVNDADTTLVRATSNQTPAPPTFLHDVLADGAINIIDVNRVRAGNGRSLAP